VTKAAKQSWKWPSSNGKPTCRNPTPGTPEARQLHTAPQSTSTNQPCKLTTILICFKANFRYTRHYNPTTLSNWSNPCNVWETYAPRRAPASISKAFESHTNHLLTPTLHVYQSLKAIATSNKETHLYSTIIYSKLLCLQLISSTMT
jgi:hypothetical protein